MSIEPGPAKPQQTSLFTVESGPKTAKNTPSNQATNAQPPQNSQAVELKGTVFTLSVLKLNTSDVKAIVSTLHQRLQQAPGFFRYAPIVIDLAVLEKDNAAIDFADLVRSLRALLLIPVGVRHGTSQQKEHAQSAGLALMQGGTMPPPAPAPAPAKKAPEPPPAAVEQPKPEIINSKIVTTPIRSGQQIYAKGDLILLAAVNAGAEVLAEGNIHAYAPLRGRALAGISGRRDCHIFSHCLEAELLSIAGQYRVIENDLPPEVKSKPAHVYLESERLTIRPLD